MQVITKENFKTETDNGVVLVDFSANWCGPCRLLTPILEQLQRVKVVKVDIDQDPELALKYKVSAVPKLLFMVNGVVRYEHLGLDTKGHLQAMVDGLLNE